MVFLLSTAGCESFVKLICHAKQHAETDRGCLHTKHGNLFFMDKAHQHEIKDELRSGAICEANAFINVVRGRADLRGRTNADVQE